MQAQFTQEEIDRAREALFAIQAEKVEILKQMERVMRDEPLRMFRPLPKQAEVHLCGKRSVWVFGGNRAGKTRTGGIKDVLYALGPKAVRYIEDWPESYLYKGKVYDTHREEYIALARSLPAKSHGWVCSESFEVQRDVVQAEILRWLPKCEIRRTTYRMKDVIDQIHLKNGSKITFKSYDQGRTKFEGAKLQWVHLDEEPPVDIHTEILMRLMDSKGTLWATMTPALRGVTFVFDIPAKLDLPDDERDPELYVMYMSWEDNPYLDDDEMKRMEQNMRPDEIEARKYGRMITPGKSPFQFAPLREMQDALVREPRRGTLTWRDSRFSSVEWSEHEGGEFMLWVAPEEGREYIIAGDVAEGLSYGDYSVAGVLDRHTKELCAVWHGHIDPDLFGDIIHRLSKWFNDAIECPERNNHGLTSIATIKHYADHNLFRMKTMGKRIDSEGEIYGWYTSWLTKPTMIDELARAIREKAINVYWRRFYEECFNFVRDAKGRYGARAGAHDDVVMMLAIALMVDKQVETLGDMPAPFTRAPKGKKRGEEWDEEEWGDDEWVS